MEEHNRTTIVKCSLCDKIPETVQLYQCPIEHQYCMDCFFKLRESYNGSIYNEATCVICKAMVIFTQSKINSDFLEKIIARSGIERLYKYDVNKIACKGSENLRPSTSNLPKQGNKPNITVETVFGLPPEELKQSLGKNTGSTKAVPINEPHCSSHESTYLSPRLNRYHITSQQSNIPMKCPHGPCKKVITTSSLISHFKHDHSEIPTHDIRRNRELCLTLDVTVIENNNNLCLGMINVYERNNINTKESRSSQTVINTFKQYIPVDSFWLMVTGSLRRKANHNDVVIFWLFCLCEDPYSCTIELCTKSGSMAFSTYCEVHSTANNNFKFEDIDSGLHGLMINTASIAALLEDGPELNLNLTIH